MSSGSQAVTSSEGPKYPGYPYVNPPSFGVPTIDSSTASRWANLPRRPIGNAVRVQDQAGSSSSQSNQDNAKPPEETISYRSDDEPVLYIDLPEDGESDMYEGRVDTPTQASRLNQEKTNEEDEEPVVYIDIPECSGSGVSERRPEVEDGPSTSVVQETIFYDQFKDRRIDVIDPRDSDDSSSSNNSTMRRPGNSNVRRPFGTATFTRPGEISTIKPIEDEAYEERMHETPQRLTSMNLWTPGSNIANTEASSSSAVGPAPAYPPSYLTSQEYQEYMTPEEEFRLPPLPVKEFPEPPPAYTEIDLTTQGYMESPAPALGSPVPSISSSGSQGGITAQPQRTRVILNDENRKQLTCQHCGMTVQSIVIREANICTHLAAISFLIFGLFPCAIFVYCTDFCKGQVHYCPNCNKKNT